jgi:surface protein
MCNVTSALATVFIGAANFNGDLSSWDVSRVTRMNYSKLCALFVSLDKMMMIKE